MPLPEFRLEAYFSEWEFKAKYHLTASDAQTMSVAALLQLAEPAERERWETLTLGYVQTRGTPALREAVAASYETLGPEHVIAFAGAQEALYCAMHALLGSGDHAVVTVPNYQSMESVPRSLCAVTGVELRAGNRWELDVDEVSAALRPNTRLIAVNFPNNPTGAVASHEAFAALVDLCRKRGIYLFSDEVYRGIERDERKRLPQAVDLYERALSLNVVSKAYGLPGLRVGWIACREEALLGRLEQLKHYLSICNPAPSEVLATIAVKARSKIWATNRARCASNLAELDEFFARHADRFEWYEPAGGCVAFPRYLGRDGVEVFCKNLLDRAGVLLLPASLYASDLAPVPTDRFRIGYGRDGIGAALAAFEEYVNA